MGIRFQEVQEILCIFIHLIQIWTEDTQLINFSLSGFNETEQEPKVLGTRWVRISFQIILC